MEALKAKVLEIVQNNPLGSFATVTVDNRPWVRYMMFKVTEDLQFMCGTYINSRKIAHLEQNAEVHITFGGLQFFDGGSYLQLEGVGKLDVSVATRSKFWDDSYLNYFSGVDDPNYGVIVIRPYRIEIIGRQMSPEILLL